jgi:pimeloyl-ACP methyl ester carboxylesterase
MAKKPLRDMVVLLPGITGSVLRKGNSDVWAISGQALWRWLASAGGTLQSLRLTDADPGDITATRLMPDAHVVPGLVKIDGYSATVRMIDDTFDVVRASLTDDRPANFIEFPYDWRLDNRIHGRRLAALIEERLPKWRIYSGHSQARVIFIAHSMGGLIARHYLEVLEGWRNCRALISFGTPYRGSLNALNFLANGYKKLFVDLTDVMRSFPSVHQLLPIYEALRVGAEYVRIAETSDVPGIDAELAKDALAFHRDIEDKVEAHRQQSDYRENGYVIVPIVGTRQPTMQSGVLSDRGVTISPELPPVVDALLADGDGTVPRASAIPIELSDAYRDSFAPERHGSLQCNRSILNDVRGRLEQMQVRGLRAVRGSQASPEASERSALAFDLDDLYMAGEPVTLRARLVNVTRPVGTVQARIEALDTAAGGPALVPFVESADGWCAEIEGLPPGLYRAEVRTTAGGPWAPPAVHDLFEVAG